MTNGRRRRSTAIAVAAVVGLAFQVFHLSEHTVQMTMWVLHPQRSPWMSPWAHDASLWLGRVDPSRASETTSSVARGMEYLHLVGNLVFLGGVVALWYLARPHPTARRRSVQAMTVQGLHVVEHVALVTTLVLVGRPLGLSTAFGLLDGTRLSTSRVWWHGGVNLFATAVCAAAVVSLLGAVSGRVTRERRAPLAVPTMLTLATPLALAFLVGQPLGSASADGHGDHRPSPQDEASGFRLVDVAGDVGLDVTHSAFHWDVTMDPVAMMGGGVCWIDVDRDGWLDLFVTDTWSDGEWGLWNGAGDLPSTRIFRNEDGHFEEYTDAWSAGHETRANGCVAADFDGDGFTDLYVTTSRDNLLLWNDDGRGFVEGAARAGVGAYGWHTGAAAGDLDGDGRIDLVVAGYADLNAPVPSASTGFPNTFAPIPDLVFLNRGVDSTGRAHFDEVARELGVDPDGSEYGLGVVLSDLDSDGDLDLYVANDTQPNRLYLNDTPAAGGVVFSEVGEQAGVADPNSGMGIAVGDLDGDGGSDVIVTNLAGQGHASLSSVRGGAGGPPVFEARSDAVHRRGLEATGWGVSVGDLDRDGRLDSLVASGAIPITSLSESSESLSFFCGLDTGDAAPTGRADEATGPAGLDLLAARNGRAVALADYDNDGDLDAVVSSIGGPLALLENRGASGSWISVDPGTPDPGLRVSVELSDGSTLERAASAGGSWLSSEDPRVHVGVPDGLTVRRVTVTGSEGDVSTFTDVSSGTVLRVHR